MTRSWVAVLLLVVVLLTSCGTSGGKAATTAYTVKGTVALKRVDSPDDPPGLNSAYTGNDFTSHDGDVCMGKGSFADIAEGAGVTVEDEASKVIATSTLQSGRLLNDTCSFDFAASVPKAAFYQVEVSHRGQTRFSFDDMTSKSWTITITVG